MSLEVLQKIVVGFGWVLLGLTLGATTGVLIYEIYTHLGGKDE